MKRGYKFTLFLLFFGFFLNTSAQYIPLLADTTVWSISPNFFPVVKLSDDKKENRANLVWLGDYIVYNQNDTLINNTNYHKVFGNSAPNDFTFLNYYGAIRESNKQVFFIANGDTNETMYYDFNLAVNDSFYMDFRYPITVNPAAYYHVDSIVYINYYSGPRKTWHLSKRIDQFSFAKIVWVEGIGYLAHPFYLNTETFGMGPYSTCGCDFVEALVCQSKNNIKQYENNCIQTSFWNLPIDDCHFDIVGSVKKEKNHDVSISPNPASNHVIINFQDKLFNEIRLLNTSGICLKKILVGQQSKLTLVTSELENGIYFLSSEIGVITKLVVIH